MSPSIQDRKRTLVEAASRLDVALSTLSRISTLVFVSKPNTLFDPVPDLDRNHPDSSQMLRIEEALLQEMTLLSDLAPSGDPHTDGTAEHLLRQADFALRRLSDIRTEQWGKLRMDIAIDEFTNCHHSDASTCCWPPVCCVILNHYQTTFLHRMSCSYNHSSLPR